MLTANMLPLVLMAGSVEIQLKGRVPVGDGIDVVHKDFDYSYSWCLGLFAISKLGRGRKEK
jgi:hypothetical protein